MERDSREERERKGRHQDNHIFTKRIKGSIHHFSFPHMIHHKQDTLCENLTPVIDKHVASIITYYFTTLEWFQVKVIQKRTRLRARFHRRWAESESTCQAVCTLLVFHKDKHFLTTTPENKYSGKQNNKSAAALARPGVTARSRQAPSYAVPGGSRIHYIN